MSKQDDINYLSGLIYEHLYQKIPSKVIESKPLSTNYITDLTIIKKMYNGKQLIELINTIFNTNLSFLGYNEFAYKFKRLDTPNLDILIRQYNKDQEIDPNNDVNVDKIINYLLSDLVIHKKTRGILLNICNADIPTKDLEIFLKKYPKIKVFGTVSVSLREHFFKMITLKEHLEESNNFKDSIFQVLHVLYIIQSMYPTFRHNNLNIDTIMVYKSNEKEIKFKIDTIDFSFKSSGEIKLTNFMKSNISGVIENNSIESKLKEKNKMYDVNTFLSSLQVLKLSKDVNEFIDRNLDKDISSIREILINDPFFNKSEDNQLQTGGKSKKSKKSRSKRSKYEMTKSEVEKILNMNVENNEDTEKTNNTDTENNQTPEEETLKYVNKTKNQPAQHSLTMETYSNRPNKFEVTPTNIPNTTYQINTAKTQAPIIHVNPPKQVIETNSLGSLLGGPEGPSTGIMDSFGTSSQPSTWKLAPSPPPGKSGNIQSAQPHIPLQPTSSVMTTVIPDPNPVPGPVPGPVPDLAQLNMKPNISPTILPNPIDDLSGLSNILNSKLNTSLVDFQKLKGGSNKIKNQKGGSDRVIPIYKGTNSSNETNEGKRIKTERFLDANPDIAREIKQNRDMTPEEKEEIQVKEDDYSNDRRRLPINQNASAFEIKINPDLLPKANQPLKPAPPDNVIKMINYMIPNNGAPGSQSIPSQFNQPSGQVLSHNTYNVTFANPSKVKEFKEDILPSRDESMLKYSMTTMSERLIIYQYIRSVLIRQSDGENINFISDKSAEVLNLLSYLRILDLQPSKQDKIKNNPYGLLPKRLVIYNSCYPIRVDRASYNVGCAKNNIGVNIRIYQMTTGETLVNKYKNLPYKSFEVWREISVYEKIRDDILKAKLSPNFAALYAYYITSDTEIDFLKINRMRGRDIIHKKEKEQKLALTKLYKQEMESYLVSLQKYSTKDLKKLVADIDIHKPSDKCIIALTESPSQNIINWSSRLYEDNGLAKKMVNTGFHSAEVWTSVLFQLYQSLLCMYKFGISYYNFDLESNVFIKSLKFDETNRGYWRYRINNIDFYIPNYGYLLMIDSAFSDVYDNDEKTLEDKTKELSIDYARIPELKDTIPDSWKSAEEKTRLTYGDIKVEELDDITYKTFSNDLIINDKDENKIIKLMNKNKKRTLDNFEKAFDANVFTKDYSLNGGIKPDDKVLGILIKIKNNIKHYKKSKEELKEDTEEVESTEEKNLLMNTLIENFKIYLHNRVGTSLKETELPNLVESDTFDVGEIVACMDNKRWGIIIEKTGENLFKVLTVNKKAGLDINIVDNLKERPYNLGDLRKLNTILDQASKPNQRLNDNDLLETYELTIN
jgi:hypothetical protein